MLDGEVTGGDWPSQGTQQVVLPKLVVVRLEDGERSLDSVVNVVAEVAVRRLVLEPLLRTDAPASNHEPALVLRNLLGGLDDALALPVSDACRGAPALVLLVHRALGHGRKPDTEHLLFPGLARLEKLDAPSLGVAHVEECSELVPDVGPQLVPVGRSLASKQSSGLPPPAAPSAFEREVVGDEVVVGRSQPLECVPVPDEEPKSMVLPA